MNPQSITYVEFGTAGHRSIYIRHISADFVSNAPGWCLNIWVPDTFFEQHSELVATYGSGTAATPGRVVFKSLSGLTARLSSGNASSRWKTIRYCLEQDGSVACFISFLDSVVKEIVFSSRSRENFKVSGLLFRPFLHYRTFPLHHEKNWPPHRKWLKAYVLNYLFFHHPLVAEVLTLDPFAPGYYNGILRTNKMRYLTDYLVTVPPRPDARDYFNIPEDRICIAFFGYIDGRKGTFEFLQALDQLFAEQTQLIDVLGIVFAGQVDKEIQDEFMRRVAYLTQRYERASIQIMDRFLTDEEVSTLFHASDIVCALYPNHVGMSGQLTLAALNECLVLGSEFGLVGELIRRFDLGVTCDATAPSAIAAALHEVVKQAKSLTIERKKKVKDFSSLYSAERFGREVRECMMRTASAAGQGSPRVDQKSEHSICVV
jgi:glycosyltransferase involved in cell wall biosynthesis